MMRFHWRLPLGGEEVSGPPTAAPPGTSARALPDVDAQLSFCRLAERYGIDSLLTAVGYYMPDPIVLVAALSVGTQLMRFMLAYRPGVMSPTAFVQQVNTISALSGGRLSLNVVLGHSPQEQRAYGDHLPYDERYRRADEFLAICRAFWGRSGDVNFDSKYYQIQAARLATPFVSPDRTAPEIYFGGGSASSRDLAARQADCWLRLGATPDELHADVEAMRGRKIDVGVRLSLVVGSTHDEAVRTARALVAERGDQSWVDKTFARGDSSSVRTTLARGTDDADQWPTPWLWTGAVRSLGPSAVCLVGTPEQIAGAIGEYRRAGVSQFIFSGWPNAQTLRTFGEHILPLVRTAEHAEAATR